MNKEQSMIFNRTLTGVLLRSLRTEAGLQQVDAAMQIGYTNATFVCSVEKGGSIIPADKVQIFASVYLPKEKLELAAAILKLGYPDYWKSSLDIICTLSDKKIKPDALDEKVDKWIEAKKEKYSINFQGKQ